jgi:hypothetical protein
MRILLGSRQLEIGRGRFLRIGSTLFPIHPALSVSTFHGVVGGWHRAHGRVRTRCPRLLRGE